MDIMTAKNNDVLLFIGDSISVNDLKQTIGMKNGYKSIFINPEGFNIYNDIDVPITAKTYEHKFKDGTFSVNEDYEIEIPIEEKLLKLENEKMNLEELLDDALSLLMETEIL